VILLSQFLLRLSFGLALAMGVTSPRRVSSGFYRVHLLVVMGLCTLAALVAANRPELPLWPPLAAAVAAYAGSVAFLYEAVRPGMVLLWFTSIMALLGAWIILGEPSSPPDTLAAAMLHWVDAPSGGLVLGGAIAAMFLGHWYLNTPTMDLAALRRLLICMAIFLLLRTAIAGAALAMALANDWRPTGGALGLLVLRWLAGLVGVGWLTWMAWETLKVPNTQSATGILYVAVIGVFAGELTSLLLSGQTSLPL
jgi:hypothetical protein